MTAHSRSRKFKKKPHPVKPKRYRFFHEGEEVIFTADNLNGAKKLFQEKYGYQPK